MATGTAPQLTPEQFCTECGKPHPIAELVRFGDSAICADCKPTFVQRMREGTAEPVGVVAYGGFWRRWVALMVDSAVLFYMLLPLFYLVAIAVIFMTITKIGFDPTTDAPSPFVVLAAIPILLLFLIAPIAYFTYFIKKSGSTPGKMMLGLKVITGLGQPISTARAIGRFFAAQLSQMIFYIGDIMAGFDSEKRALHDRICETRVIRIDPPVLGRRMAAFFVDTLLIQIVTYSLLFLWIRVHHLAGFLTPSVSTTSAPSAIFMQSFLQFLPVTLISMGLQIVYSVYFTSQKGATLGKMWLGLKVVTADGGPISVARAFGRYLATLLAQLLFGIGLTMAAFDDQCRALEDRLCNTRVVRA